MNSPDDKLKVIRYFIENWKSDNKIRNDFWKRLKNLFSRGDKSCGFIRSKLKFLNYIELSKKSFIKKYAKYILPTEYRGYLLESINISNLYQEGLIVKGDEKRKELGKINPKAIRIYNLYNTGILSIVFTRIDKKLEEGKSVPEITGEASKLLDDLINDKSIIYVNLYTNKDEIYSKIKQQLQEARYCLVHGSGNNSQKIKDILNRAIDDTDFKEFEIKQDKRKIGNVWHHKLLISEKIIIKDSTPEEN